MKIKKLPSFLEPYFWDVDFKKMSGQKSKMLILKSVLERGNIKAIRWLFRNFTKKDVKQLLFTDKDLSPLTSNFWADYFNIDKVKIPSLKNPSPRKVPKVLTSEYLINIKQRIN